MSSHGRSFAIAGLLLAVFVALTAPALAASWFGPSLSSDAKAPALVAAKKKKGKKGKNKGKGKGKADAAAETTETETLDLSQPAATEAPAAPPPPAAAPVLDLSEAGTDTEAAKQELLLGAPADDKDDKKKKKAKQADGSFDFGGGATLDLGGGDAIDFGSDLGAFDVQIDINSAEKERFDQAIELMSDEDYAGAALEFRAFLDDPKYTEFKPEAEYQLAKALYKLGFLDASLKRFRTILEQGAQHRRYRKSVEWLFFISRKVADETPVLAELARFRNVTFPKAYRNEYRYLLGKYLFVQAQRFEVQRLQEEQLARGKKSKEASFDFSGVAESIDSGGAMDFSQAAAGFDFGSADGGGGGGSFDFGGGGGGGGGGDSGFDFGGGGGGGSGGGFDFGSGGGAPAPDPSSPTREAAPTTTKEAITQGLDFLTQVDKDSKFYPRAQYLNGLLHYLNGEDQKAVDAFQEVVRVLNPRAGARLDPKLRELAFLSLARIHYGYRQFDRAVYYYDLIDRDSENWLTALFEASWAYYRRGDFDKALGNLLTLHSPFFEREYFPESQIVKAIIYFEACRYPETRGIVDNFLSRFTQVMKEIEKIANSKDAPELLYERIAQLQKEAAEKEEDVTARVVSLALADTDIRTARDVVQQLKDQLELLRQQPESLRQSHLGTELAGDLKTAIAEKSREAGEVTRKKFEQQLYDLKSLLAQALKIKLEVSAAEVAVLEKRNRGEATDDELIPAQERTVVGDEHVYWPYEGEYWRDELGTYELDFTMCRPMGS